MPFYGFVYGFVNFTTMVPSTNYDGYRIDSSLNLCGVREIFFIVESAIVDPMNPGPLFLISKKTDEGIDIVHFDLSSPDPTTGISGTAALNTDLDEDPVQF